MTMHSTPMNILVLGASYGLAAGMRAAIAGHNVDFVCLPDDAKLINAGRFAVRVKARTTSDQMLELGAADCRRAPNALAATDVQTGHYDLALLAMQEPQYAADELTRLVQGLMASKVPCISIMNMPLPNYLEDRLGIAVTDELSDSWHNPALWMGFDPALFTAASPDPQAIRQPDDDRLLLEVTLPSNLKVAPFRDPNAQAKLQRLTYEMDAAEVERDGEIFFPAARLVAHHSAYVPMAKWPMLLTGNFRCFRDGPPVSINRAVHDDLEASRSVYTWVTELCAELIGNRTPANERPFVPFDRYSTAARSLSSPSSIARGLTGGATRVERVDKLLQLLGIGAGKRHPAVDAMVAEVDRLLTINVAQAVTGK